MEKSRFIDFSKGFAILTIVIYHFTRLLPMPKMVFYAVNFGGAGVHLFFFASGFGLALSKYNGYVKFLLRRLDKILIPYYITITLIFLINLLTHIYPDAFSVYFSHIFLYKMFVSKYESSLGIQFWFMSTIIQFYLVFPLLLTILKTGKYKAFLKGAIIISLAYSLGLCFTAVAGDRIYNSFFLQYLWEFVLGMVIAKTNSLDKLINKPIFYYYITAVTGVAVTGFLAIKGGDIGRSFDDIFSFAAYTSIVIIIYRTFKFLTPIILWITGFSYALYLTHMLIYDTCNHYFHVTFKVVTFIFWGAVGIAWIYNLLIERIVWRTGLAGEKHQQGRAN